MSENPRFDGKTKVYFRRKLGTDWKDLADIFEIPTAKQARFKLGDESGEIWAWLENNNRLAELAKALKDIDRPDLAGLLEEAPKPRLPTLRPPDYDAILESALSELSDRFDPYGKELCILVNLKRIHDQLHEIRQSGVRKLRESVLPRLREGELSVEM